jgi:hypothetical protein
MKQLFDDKTIDFIGIKSAPGRKRKYANDAEKQAAFRSRSGKSSMTVLLSPELLQAFNEYLKFKNVSKNDVIERLLTTQLLRKR